MKYEVMTTATAVWKIVVEADSEADARERVFLGEYDGKYDEVVDYRDEEIFWVEELK